MLLRLTFLLLAMTGVDSAQSGRVPTQVSGTQTPRSQRVPVEGAVNLEVLDWGGSGRPLVLLTGLGNDAHIFDDFAPKLTARYHVYGISRRGSGASDKPPADEAGYSASRLGEDVLAVMNALHISKPVIAGHSLAGEEMSYIGSQHPEKVAALIYMEAAYPYALYDQDDGNLGLDAIALRKELLQFTSGYDYEPVKDYKGLLEDLERVEKEVKQQEQRTEALPPTPVSPRMTPELFAIMRERERFTTIQVPSLVIFGVDPLPVGLADSQDRAQSFRQRLMMSDKERQIAAVKRQIPSAQIVLIPGASHYVFQSKEAQVLKYMTDFITRLP